jgi:hypothetical protein
LLLKIITGKEITADLLKNNVYIATKCFLKEEEILFQFDKDYIQPVSLLKWNKHL